MNEQKTSKNRWLTCEDCGCAYCAGDKEWFLDKDQEEGKNLCDDCTYSIGQTNCIYRPKGY